MKITTSYHAAAVAGLHPPAHSPPKPEKRTVEVGPLDVWDSKASPRLDATGEGVSYARPGPQVASPRPPQTIEDLAPLTIFLEDRRPRTYFQSFQQPQDLTRCPPDFLETWASRVDIHPAKFFDGLLDSDKVELSSGDVSVEGQAHQMGWLEYNLKLADPASGEKVGSMSREICFDEDGAPQVSHNYFRLTPELQGQGLGKELLAKSVEMYDQIGVKSVSLYAGLDVGGYAWAKYGFKPDPGEDTKWLFDTIRGKLDGLGVSEGVRKGVEGLLADNDPEAIWAISDLNGVTVEGHAGPTTLGKALLLGTSWAGTLDLTCPDSRTRFDQYINKGGQSGSLKGA